MVNNNHINPIDDVVKGIMAKSDRLLQEDMVRNIVHWGFSVLANRTHKRIEVDSDERMLNYYGIVFSGSNTGKTWVLNKMKALIEADGGRYLEKLRESFDRNSEINGDRTTNADKTFISIFSPYNMESTVQGIHKTAEAMGTCSMSNGSLNFYSDELFASAKKDIMDRLVMGHDGEYQAPIIKGSKEENDRYEDVSGLPTNLIGMSAIDGILRETTKLSVFMGDLERAWFKRSFITIDDEHKKGRKEREDYQLSNETKDYIFALQYEEQTSKIKIGYDAEILFDKMRDKIFSGVGRYNGLRNPYNALSLAGIRCVADSRNEISGDDMQYAIDFEDRCFKMGVRFCRLEEPFMRAFYELTLEAMSETEMVTRKILPRKKSEREDLILLLGQYAIENNAQLHINMVDGVTRYKIEKLSIAPAIVRLSYSDKLTEDKKPVGNFISSPPGKFGLQFMKWMDNKSIAPWLFNESQTTGSTNRTKDNATESYMICFDFERQIDKDTGQIFEMTIDDAKELFCQYEYIIRTSKSHMIEDKGNRFHVYIPYKHTMVLDADSYKDTYMNIARRFGILEYIDKSTSHRASCFAEVANPLISEYNLGKKLDYRCCIPNTTEASNMENAYIDIQDADFKNYRLKSYLERVIPDLVEGNRDNVVNAFVFAAKNTILAESEDIRAALDIIASHIQFDRNFTKSQMAKFYKRI